MAFGGMHTREDKNNIERIYIYIYIIQICTFNGVRIQNVKCSQNPFHTVHRLKQSKSTYESVDHDISNRHLPHALNDNIVRTSE